VTSEDLEELTVTEEMTSSRYSSKDSKDHPGVTGPEADTSQSAENVYTGAASSNSRVFNLKNRSPYVSQSGSDSPSPEMGGSLEDERGIRERFPHSGAVEETPTVNQSSIADLKRALQAQGLPWESRPAFFESHLGIILRFTLIRLLLYWSIL